LLDEDFRPSLYENVRMTAMRRIAQKDEKVINTFAEKKCRLWQETPVPNV